MSAFKPTFCSPHAANHAADAAWLCLFALESLPLWKDWVSGRTCTRRRGREGYGRRFTAQNSKGKPSLFPLGSGVANRSGTEVPEILIVLYSHFLSFRSCCFTIYKASNLHFSFDSLRHPAGLVYTQETCGGAGKQSNFTNTEVEIVQGQMLREKRKKTRFPNSNPALQVPICADPSVYDYVL